MTTLWAGDPAQAALQPGASWDQWTWPNEPTGGIVFGPNDGPQLPQSPGSRTEPSPANSSGDWYRALDAVLRTGVQVVQADTQRDIAIARANPQLNPLLLQNLRTSFPTISSISPTTLLLIGGAVLALMLFSGKK